MNEYRQSGRLIRHQNHPDRRPLRLPKIRHKTFRIWYDLVRRRKALCTFHPAKAAPSLIVTWWRTLQPIYSIDNKFYCLNSIHSNELPWLDLFWKFIQGINSSRYPIVDIWYVAVNKSIQPYSVFEINPKKNSLKAFKTQQ